EARAKLALAEKQGLVSRAHPLNVDLGSAAPTHTDHVEPNQVGQRPMSHGKRDDVGANPAKANNHCAFADAHKLTHTHAATKHDVIRDVDMPCQQDVVCENHVIANLAIMRHVRSDHEKTSIPDFGDATAILGSRAHRYAFANVAIRADHQF